MIRRVEELRIGWVAGIVGMALGGRAETGAGARQTGAGRKGGRREEGKREVELEFGVRVVGEKKLVRGRGGDAEGLL
jgi:hypothetical protein